MKIDTKLAVDLCEAFLPEYRKLQSEEKAAPRDEVALPSAASTHRIVFNLNMENFPEEAITYEGVQLLSETWKEIDTSVKRPFEDVADGREAVAVILRRHILALAQSYLLRLALFLACDRMFHPEGDFQVDAYRVWGVDVDDLQTRYLMMILAADVLNAAYSDLPRNGCIANELRLLQLAGGIFFDVCEEVFNVKPVARCRTGFNLLVQSVGTPSAHERVANYSRRHKTMYRSIVEWIANGGRVESKDIAHGVRNNEELQTLIDEVKNNTRAIDDNTRAVANMDRRLRIFLDKVKKVINAFLLPFRSGSQTSSRGQVAGALADADRYACLARTKEPHRSQLKAVIDYTWKNPIVHEGKRKGDFTLAAAVRAVWNTNRENWSKVEGTFDRFEDLKSACYNLRERDDDPFTYRTRP